MYFTHSLHSSMLPLHSPLPSSLQIDTLDIPKVTKIDKSHG